MTQIERRQAHLRMIKVRSGDHIGRPIEDFGDDAVPSLELHHHIGKSESAPEHVGLMIQRNIGDPAVNVCILLQCLIMSLDELTLCDHGFLGLYTQIEKTSATSNQGIPCDYKPGIWSGFQRGGRCRGSCTPTRWPLSLSRGLGASCAPPRSGIQPLDSTSQLYNLRRSPRTGYSSRSERPVKYHGAQPTFRPKLIACDF